MAVRVCGSYVSCPVVTIFCSFCSVRINLIPVQTMFSADAQHHYIFMGDQLFGIIELKMLSEKMKTT